MLYFVSEVVDRDREDAIRTATLLELTSCVLQVVRFYAARNGNQGQSCLGKNSPPDHLLEKQLGACE